MSETAEQVQERALAWAAERRRRVSLQESGTCRHLKQPTGELVECPSCNGKTRLKLFKCAIHGKCTVDKSAPPIMCCRECPSYSPMSTKRWAYGVTTVLSRRDDLLPRTLASLAKAGFDKPRLFVDNSNRAYDECYWQELETTCHYPPLLVSGNWVLSLYELYIRDPNAERYAMFQDDFVTYPNLRSYLERCQYPDKGYWNLYTFPSNQDLCPKSESGEQKTGWYLSNQFGRGAVALVFDRPTVIDLLSSRHIVSRFQDCHRGHRAIDGGIVTALAHVGVKEYVHNPSLVQHTGLVSSWGNKPQLLSTSFRGEDFNALDLLAAGASLQPTEGI